MVINPRPRRLEARTAGTRPSIDTDCTSEAKWAELRGPKGETGDRGPAGPPGPAGKDGRDITEDDIARIVVSVVEQLRNDPSLRGMDGKDGAVGPAGPPGQPGKDAIVDYDRLAAEVIKKLPPIAVQQLDKNGKLIAEGDAYLGGTLKLYHASEQPYRPLN